MTTRTLSFDGKGINGPDMYRTRLATFSTTNAANAYGTLFAAAPKLLAALEAVTEQLDDWASNSEADDCDVKACLLAHAAIKYAKEGGAP